MAIFFRSREKGSEQLEEALRTELGPSAGFDKSEKTSSGALRRAAPTGSGPARGASGLGEN